MSFILDALKKAEAERNRHIAPVLMDARIAPPRRGLPGWAWALGAVVLVNLVALGWLLWHAHTEADAVSAATAAPASAANTLDAPGPAPDAPPGSSTAAARATQPGGTPGQPPPPGGTFTQPPPPQPGGTLTQPPPPQPGGTLAPPSSGTPPGNAAPALAGPAIRPQPADFDRLPRLDELRAAGVALPELQLNLHVYDPAPAYRSVLLNGHRLREGEFTPNGVKVEGITPMGVVLEAAGRRFRLDVGG